MKCVCINKNLAKRIYRNHKNYSQCYCNVYFERFGPLLVAFSTNSEKLVRFTFWYILIKMKNNYLVLIEMK